MKEMCPLSQKGSSSDFDLLLFFSYQVSSHDRYLVTLSMLQKAEKLSLKECLLNEYRLALKFRVGHRRSLISMSVTNGVF